jgi:hypothetical protein
MEEKIIPPKKYALHPGFVKSRTDGDRHYISAKYLAFLYGVDMRECEIYSPGPNWSEMEYRQAGDQMRRERVARGEMLGAAAERYGITSAQLSAVELGRKSFCQVLAECKGEKND